MIFIVDYYVYFFLNWDNQIGKYFLFYIIFEVLGDVIESVIIFFVYLCVVRQLFIEFKCVFNWESVVVKFEVVCLDFDEFDIWGDWISCCLEGVYIIFLDDGLDNKEVVEDFDWYILYVQSLCKRIFRIEVIVLDLIKYFSVGEFYDVKKVEVIIKDFVVLKEFWENWVGLFDNVIKNVIDDFFVVGFKSVVVYRIGLDVVGKELSGDVVQFVLKEVVKKFLKVCIVRLEDLSLNDYVIYRMVILI